MQNYTQEQIADITEREKKALAFLKELQLSPAAMIEKVNLGNDTFGDKLVPFLRDFKYDAIPSPIQKADITTPAQGSQVTPKSTEDDTQKPE